MPDVKRTRREGKWWTARVRYDHEFDDAASAEPAATQVDASDVAQGATAKVRDGRVEVVYVPDGQLRSESDVEDIAQQVTRALETDQ